MSNSHLLPPDRSLDGFEYEEYDERHSISLFKYGTDSNFTVDKNVRILLIPVSDKLSGSLHATMNLQVVGKRFSCRTMVLLYFST